MQTPYNTVYKKQNKNLIPSIRSKAVIRGLGTYGNSGSLVADVSLINNPQTVIKGVSVSYSASGAGIQIGSRCVVDIFDETNFKDMVVAYLY